MEGRREPALEDGGDLEFVEDRGRPSRSLGASREQLVGRGRPSFVFSFGGLQPVQELPGAGVLGLEREHVTERGDGGVLLSQPQQRPAEARVMFRLVRCVGDDLPIGRERFVVTAEPFVDARRVLEHADVVRVDRAQMIEVLEERLGVPSLVGVGHQREALVTSIVLDVEERPSRFGGLVDATGEGQRPSSAAQPSP